MSASFDAVDGKLREADFFLVKLAEAGLDCDAWRFYFSAFVSAARSVTFAIQHAMRRIDGFDEWYSARQKVLRENALCRFFTSVRNETQKRGTNPVTVWHGSNECDVEAFFLYWYEDPDQMPPDEDVVASAQQYMEMLASLVYEAYRDFGHFIDPAVVYSLEGARRRGLSIEDIEQELIGVRGWTASLPTEERFRILRENEPMPQIDDILVKYLGHDRFGTKT